MSTTAGIWIDTKKAIIIKLFEEKHSIKTIESTIETKERIPGESKKFGRFGNQYLTYEKNRENKRIEQTNLFLKTILKELYSFEKIVIFGPSKMKNLLEKEVLSDSKLIPKLEGIYNCDRLTENQKVAWVKNYFKVNV